ncbi:stage III sporulation protein AA [Acetohalobium arabaticum]|uniref:Stage III sporulation protein AA n=1 Tax=Acetohalobium arabaticum (strain ATCC 49924 / DSM 5501 / Z-7288) TaxID=574087 RepID=D9QRW6_ACEAZ|nr:stage III sporulation protein AA [Acetohalobium arabaticum]ADL13257.1 stage III sporulation protein AA [Acetohalobium arabaticum DSM 5501]
MIERIKEEIFPVLATTLRRILRQVDTDILSKTEEIRLRTDQPLILNLHHKEAIITKNGRITKDFKRAYYTTKQDIEETMNLMTQHSLYALEEELQQGYLTLAGGHRVGFVGQVVSDLDEIELIKNFSGLNIRISQEIIGAADEVIGEVISNDQSQSIYNTLIISPPQCGKTTLLRDLIRQLSTGLPEQNFSGLKVGVVDERGELGGSYQGVVQNQLGIRTDLLANCPKSQGMILLIRAMSPEVIVTDEIGSRQDVQAICEAVNAGVKIVTSVHGRDLKEIKQRPNLEKLLGQNFFKKFIILSRRQGPGTVEEIIKAEDSKSRLTEKRKIL